ncbi:DUF4189 domain-containing protein [Mycolicibacterium austroafricanum]|uniref:DUF4189 domain-containing protein n=1 Tax=Mycolicibacterium austroafricanum TaxID=39687 RepID=A0ABT8HE38_MYCAO|nr:DUF4189 domain-containing protein [Mycolicibacterium austroafricanum]MDN4518552.1 DUF4189 domain-containing protein [Mycolicibacterium austroafricanum]QRZ08578.1 DUF4189 domain-containing protein [Mycolicibacterium austroafricanum]QZT70228.1 DUF4189 domain-containing protein [Mycolicibacterium austroafricanum]
MITTSKNRVGWQGRTAAAILVAAGTAAVGLLTPAPAQAADQYIALALGYVSENPPVTMAGGSSISATQDGAAQGALTNCSNNGAGHCVTVVIATNECAAAASNDYGEEVGSSGATIAAASSSALAKLQNQTGAKVIVSGCSNGNTPPPPPNDPPPPPAPKLGPTVSFDTVVGGLVAHIADRSGVSSQCTYTADNFNRAFALSANSTYDLRIVPAVPRFKNWNVTIACDNGTSTATTTYF